MHQAYIYYLKYSGEDMLVCVLEGVRSYLFTTCCFLSDFYQSTAVHVHYAECVLECLLDDHLCLSVVE